MIVKYCSMILLLFKSHGETANFGLRITHLNTGNIQNIQRMSIFEYAFLLVNRLHKQNNMSQITFWISALSIYKFIQIKPFTYPIFIIPHQLPQILMDIFSSLKKSCQRKKGENMLFWAILTSFILFGGAFIFQQQTATWKTSYQWLKNMIFSYCLRKIQLSMKKWGTKVLLILYLPHHLF